MAIEKSHQRQSSDKNLNEKKTFLRVIKSVRCIKANELQKLLHVNLTTSVGAAMAMAGENYALVTLA